MTPPDPAPSPPLDALLANVDSDSDACAYEWVMIEYAMAEGGERVEPFRRNADRAPRLAAIVRVLRDALVVIRNSENMSEFDTASDALRRADEIAGDA